MLIAFQAVIVRQQASICDPDFHPGFVNFDAMKTDVSRALKFVCFSEIVFWD